MNSEKKSSVIYKTLKPSAVLEVTEIIFFIILGLTIIALLIFGLYASISDGETETAVCAGIGICVFAALYGFFGVRGIITTKKLNAKRKEIAENIDIYTLEKLEEELSHTELMYKTFYLMEDYLYVPSAKLLIRYDEIKNFKNIIHSINGVRDGIRTAVTDAAGLVFEFRVKRWRTYFKELNSFNAALNEKLIEKRKEPHNKTEC